MLARKKSFTSAIVGALVALSIIALVLSLVRVEDVTLSPTVKYGMVFDAGSSHTSLFVYEWDSDKENNTGVVSQTLSCDVQGQYPLSWALSCPVRVLGMCPVLCILPREQNSSATEQVLAEVAKTMQEYPVAFKGARILTGEEEGAYGWITINYLLDSFTKVGEGWNPHSFSNTAFLIFLKLSQCRRGSVLSQNEASELTLYGYSYKIYTHSYLCYGQNEMLKRLAKELIVESSSSTRVQHPCYPKGYTETVSLSSFRASPCTGGSDPRLALGDSTVTLEGRGNASACLAALRKLFNFSACGQSQHCSFDGVYQPPLRGQFVAFSAFYYNFKFLNLTEGQPLAVVREAIEGLCTRSWEDLSSSYPKENPKRLPKYCANANYILTLLLDAYKFNETTWNNIIFQMKAGSADVGWTLGYMLNLTNMIPAEAPATLKGHRPSLWAAAITFIIFTLILGLTALLLLLWL
ncbi:ectonucleoside triphosphate diphosphohydrolase 8-like [Acridotheres tristis]